MTLHPDQRPKPKTWDDRPLAPSAVCEVKEDGIRLTVWREKDGVRVRGRKPEIDLWWKLAKHEQLRDLFLGLPPGTVVDGELVVVKPGSYATDVLSLLAKDPSALDYRPFAVPFARGIDFREEPLAVHRSLLEEADFILPRTLDLVHASRGSAYLKRLAKKLGVEGFVLKEAAYRSWWKVKPVYTSDCVVTGTKPGKGKHAGRLGALVVSQYVNDELVEVGSVGKGCDDQWRDLSEEAVMGRVLEVQHEGKQALGKLKFSSFLRWRDDKPAAECVATGS